MLCEVRGLVILKGNQKIHIKAAQTSFQPKNISIFLPFYPAQSIAPSTQKMSKYLFDSKTEITKPDFIQKQTNLCLPNQ